MDHCRHDEKTVIAPGDLISMLPSRTFEFSMWNLNEHPSTAVCEFNANDTGLVIATATAYERRYCTVTYVLFVLNHRTMQVGWLFEGYVQPHEASTC